MKNKSFFTRPFYGTIFSQPLFYNSSNSFIQTATQASLGILQSPLGESEIPLTRGPSGTQERLNCCEKKRQ